MVKFINIIKYTSILVILGFILIISSKSLPSNRILVRNATAVAYGESTEGDCCANGYKYSSTTLSSDGKDCWCEDVEGPWEDCECSK